MLVLKVPRNLFTLIVVASCGAPSHSAHEHAPGFGAAASGLKAGGRLGTHGMVVFGDSDGLYLSHIPMFHAPHDYQAVLAVTAKGAGALASSPERFASGLYTFLPDPCSLDDVLLGTLTTLNGTLYQGNFEAPDGKPLEAATFVVSRVVVAEQLHGRMQPATALTYFAFPANERVFLVHAIAAAPSFDQVVVAQWPAASTAPRMADTIVIARFADTVSARLQAGDGPISAENVSSGGEVELTVLQVLQTLVGPHFSSGPNDGKP